MSYVKFNDQNISEVQSLHEQEGEGWYEIPSEHEGASLYRLVNGEVTPFTANEFKQHNREVFKSSYQKSIKISVSNVLTETDWLVQRHLEQSSSEEETSLSITEYSSLLSYRSSLRSLTSADLYPEEYVIPEFPLKDKYSFRWIEDLENLHKSIPQELIP